MSESLNGWLDRTTGGDSLRSIARAINAKHPTLSRQIAAGDLDPTHVVAIARAYDGDAIQGLLASGLLVQHDVRRLRDTLGLREASDAEIADEILRRLNERGTDNLDEEPPARVSGGPLRLVSDDVDPSELEGEWAADEEHPGDDPGED